MNTTLDKKMSNSSAQAVPGSQHDALIEGILSNPHIPSPPALAIQILQKAGQADCKVKEISDLLAHDPGLSAKILKTLNSAVFGLSRPVTSVQQAVAILGSRALRSLVLGLSLPVMQARTDAVSNEGLKRYWKESLAGGIMARELSRRMGFPAPEDDLAASLLRDLGMILLWQAFGDRYADVWLRQIQTTLGSQCQWETEQFGLHHAEIGAMVLERWGLPAEITLPIRFHHHVDQIDLAPQYLIDRAYLLEFTGELAQLEMGQVNRERIQFMIETAFTRYRLRREDLEEFLNMMRPKIQEFSAILGVDIGQCPDFREVLASGCEDLVRMSLEEIAAPSPRNSDSTGSRAYSQTFPTEISLKNMLFEIGENRQTIKNGFRLLQFEIMEVIGRGSMGVVFKAHDPTLARNVAIKVLAPELAQSEKAHQRFAQEARFAAAVRHPNVVSIFAVHEAEGMPFLVMEFVPGVSLADAIENGRQFSISEIAKIGYQTALGLAAAHDLRLIHRDIKPGNILLERGTDNVRVADFGLARALDEDTHLSHKGLIVGTPNYMSPEQVDGKPLTFASDLFSLGSVLYTLCTGLVPFKGETMSSLLRAVAEKRPIPVKQINPTIPFRLAIIIEQLHAKNPANRFRSAMALADALQPWIE